MAMAIMQRAKFWKSIISSCFLTRCKFYKKKLTMLMMRMKKKKKEKDEMIIIFSNSNKLESTTS